MTAALHTDALWLTLAVACCLAATGEAAPAVRVIFDTDIMGDVDDVGAVAVLHALADRGEAEILAMGVSAKHPACVPCLDALNTYFGRADIPIGVVKGKGFLKRSRYSQQVADEFPHDLTSAADAPDAASLYRKVLASQPDGGVVFISVGQLTNFRNLLRTQGDAASPLGGPELVRRKVKLWVCMGGRFPKGREANLVHDGPAAAHAIAQWPTPIVFSGWEIGARVLTGGRDGTVRLFDLAGGELLETLMGHSSWVQAVRFLGDGPTEALTAGSDGRILRWDLASGAVTAEMEQGEAVRALAVSADAGLACAAGSSGTVVIWDLADGSRLQDLTGHRASVTGLAITGDGRHVVSASADTSLLVWALPGR